MCKKEEKYALVPSQDQSLSNIIEQTTHLRNIDLAKLKKDLLNVQYTDDVIEKLLEASAHKLGFTDSKVVLNQDTTIRIDECDFNKVVKYAKKQGFKTYDPNQSQEGLNRLEEVKQKSSTLINSSSTLLEIIRNQGFVKTQSNKILLFEIEKEDGSLDTPYNKNTADPIIADPDTTIVPFVDEDANTSDANTSEFVYDTVMCFTLKVTIGDDDKQTYAVTNIGQELCYIKRKQMIPDNIRVLEKNSVMSLNDIIEEFNTYNIWKNIKESNEKLKNENEIDHYTKEELKEQIRGELNKIIQIKELSTSKNYTKIESGQTILFKSYKDVVTKSNEENDIIKIINSRPVASQSRPRINKVGFTRSIYEKRQDKKLTLIFPTFMHDDTSVNQRLSRNNLINCFNNTKLARIDTINIIFPLHIPGHWLTIEMYLELHTRQCKVFCHNNLPSNYKLSKKARSEIRQFINYLIQHASLDMKSGNENDNHNSVVRFKKSEFRGIKRSSRLNCGPATVLDVCNLAQGKPLEGVCNKDDGAIKTRIDHMHLIQSMHTDPCEEQRMLAQLLPQQLKKGKQKQDEQKKYEQNEQLLRSKGGLTRLNIFLYACMSCSIVGILSVNVVLFTHPKNNVYLPLVLGVFIIVLLASVLGKVCQKPNNKVVSIEVQQIEEQSSQLTT